MMRTQRSNYRRKTDLHFHPAVEGEGLDPFCLGMQMAVEPQEAGERDKGQQGGLSLLRLTVLAGSNLWS